MKIDKRYIVAFFKALPISLFVIGVIYYTLNNLRDAVELRANSQEEIVDKKPLTIEEIKEKHMIKYNTLFLTCSVETNKSETECYHDILQNFNFVPNVKKEKDSSASEKSNFLIYIIYAIIFISLQSQLMLFFIRCKKKTVFYISEFNLNAPATLGILGTIISFAIVASLSQNGNIQSLFLANFFNAVITTALGVSVYIINLFLNIYISPRIEQK